MKKIKFTVNHTDVCSQNTGLIFWCISLLYDHYFKWMFYFVGWLKKKTYYSVNIFPFLYIFVVFLLIIFNGPFIFGCCRFVLFDLTNCQSEDTEWVSEVAQSCPTLCDPMDCSLPGSSVHGISQARIQKWVAISFSRRSSQPRDCTWVSHIVGRHFYRLHHQGSLEHTRVILIFNPLKQYKY